MSRRVETLSRLNGAVNVGNTDLILPVRVRTRAENVGRTLGFSRRYVASAHQSMGVSERPANVIPKGGALAWVDVRASSPRAKHSNESRLVSPERRNTETLSGFPGVWRCHLETTVFLPDR